VDGGWQAGTAAANAEPSRGHLVAVDGTPLRQGALASCMAVTLSNPLEVVKIRLQLQGELIRRGEFVKAYRSVPHGFYVIAKTEGASWADGASRQRLRG